MLESPLPRPGEIWEVRSLPQTPLEFSEKEKQDLYSREAWMFLRGNAPSRYVLIVNEAEVASSANAPCQVITVMLLSPETHFLSNVDLLLPSFISGLDQDLLVETWHVQPMLTVNLLKLVGKRLSRGIYDLLLNVGDHYHGLQDNHLL